MTILASDGGVSASSGSILASGYDGGLVMALASGTRVQITYQEEPISQGVPDAAPAMKVLRATSRNINPQINTIRSDEVRQDRQQASSRHGFNQVVGNPGFELSLAAYDDMLEAAMSGTWDATVTTPAAQDISIVAAAGNATFTRAAGDYLGEGFRIGQVVTPSGYVAAENNGDGVVVQVTATVLTIAAIGTAYTTEAGTTNEQIVANGSSLDVGTTLRTYTIERGFLDVSQYQLFNGCAVNQMSLSIQPESMVTGTLDIIGMSADPMSGTSRDASPTLAAANEPMSAFDGGLYENGVLTAVVTGVDFNLNNNRTLQGVVGSKTSPNVFEGTATISGEMTVFFEDANLFNRFINETLTTLVVKLDDINGTDFITFAFPAIKYTGGDMDPPQQGPVPIRMPFEAQVHVATGTSMTVFKSN